MGKIIVIGSQKGGVGKTTTTLNLAYSLKELGKKVLTVDFDSQANLTTCYGVENTGALEYTIGHLMMDQMEEEMPENFEDYIQSRDGVDYLPSSIYLSVVDAKLRTEMGAERMLAEALEPLKSRYDYILIDTCPSLGMLTINALAAADEVIITVNPQLLAMMGLQDFLRIVGKIKKRINPKLEVAGILLTMCESRRFNYPKSLYAVKDCINFFVADKKDALIVDFFAGSGTTMHAVNLLNSEDGGRRRCICITNNEVSDVEAKKLQAEGYRPGDNEWLELGIARYVTWPRIKCSITGQDVDGKTLKGNYENGRSLSEGFKENAIFFKLGFLDKTSVALGRQLSELFPVLWMKSGAYGACPKLENDRSAMKILPDNHMAVLIDEKKYIEFVEALNGHPEIETIYFVTDSDAGYKEMILRYPDKTTFQLYRDYLDNFRINVGR